MPKTFTVYRPGRAYPGLSVTGNRCALQCKHCQGRYLRGMLPADSPERLLDVGLRLRDGGASGVLISGGCDANGTVPLMPFLDTIARLSSEMTVNVHTGLLDDEAARKLAATGADVYSVDLLQDERTIKERLHLDARPEDYENTIRSLISAGASVVPHVCVGLQPPRGEDRCLELLERLAIDGVVVLALMPPPGTMPAADLDDRLVAFVERASRSPAPVLVGCMRPRGRWETEVRCILAGAAGMASPSSRTVDWLRRNDYQIVEKNVCCALHRKMAPRT